MADYVNGKKLYEELKIYRAKYDESILKKEAKPQVSDKIAIALVQIATRLMNSYNFIGYSYKDEMISDAILKCFDKVHRFDPSISENAFAFFTQCAWHAATNRIKIEQKESSVKARLIREKMSSEFVSHGVDSDTDDGSNAFVEFLKENDSYIDYIEIKKEKAFSVPDSMKHRNKSGYTKKAVVPKIIIEEIDLTMFESA